MPDKMKRSELNSILDNEVANSVGQDNSFLSENRAKAMEYYLGQSFGNEVDGRSHYVSRDVQDTVEWIMPQLMEIITDGHKVVRFAPQNEDDIPAAKTETDYANYVFFRQNRGWQILHDFVKSALIEKTGIIKHWFDESEEKATEQYNNISAIQLGQLQTSEELTIVEDSLVENEDTTFDVKVIRIISSGKIKIVNVPPEEFVVSTRTKNLPSSDFCGHIYVTNMSSLKEMGIDERKLNKIRRSQSSTKSAQDIDSSNEKIARFLDNETNPADNTGQRTDEAMRDLTVEDLFIRVDYDGDGIADRVYKPNSLVDQLVWKYPLAKLLLGSPVMQMLHWVQSEFPTLHPGGVTDSAPLMQPPSGV